MPPPTFLVLTQFRLLHDDNKRQIESESERERERSVGYRLQLCRVTCYYLLTSLCCRNMIYESMSKIGDKTKLLVALYVILTFGSFFNVALVCSSFDQL